MKSEYSFFIQGLERNTIYAATLVKWMSKCHMASDKTEALKLMDTCKRSSRSGLNYPENCHGSPLNLAAQHKEKYQNLCPFGKVGTGRLWLCKISSFFTGSFNAEEILEPILPLATNDQTVIITFNGVIVPIVPKWDAPPSFFCWHK